jgi:hypothetical protein
VTELEWIDVDSTAVASVAYDVAAEVIYVRFTSGVEYAYEACPPHVWEEFTAPGQSHGKYVNETLKCKPYHRLGG